MSWETLSFEDRQKNWAGHRRQFRQHHGRSDRPTVWEIEFSGDRVTTRHGLLNGAVQETSYVGLIKNKGKVNEISAEQDAVAEARRDARKRFDFEGYDEYVGDLNIDRRHADINVHALLTNLPGSFCLYKPENNIETCKKLLAKAEKGQVLYTLKRDGVAKWVVVDYYGNVVIYSRRSRPWNDKEGPKELPDGTLDFSTVIPWSARFPHLVEEVKKMQLPPGSMLACELVMHDRDNFPLVSGYTKGYTARALEDMAKKGYPSLYVWDMPFYDGEDLVSNKTVRERHRRLQHHCALTDGVVVWPVQYFNFPNPEAASEYARKNKLEGWVVVDPDAIYGDKAWNLKGKPDRPSTCAKLKPRSEDDFVAIWDPNDPKQAGSGKHEKGKTVTLPNGQQVVHGGVGSVGLWQYNSKGELVFTATCSSGMDYEFQAQLDVNSFPQVWQVEYLERTYISDGEKTNALRHPVFIRKRDDKTPQECVNERLV